MYVSAGMNTSSQTFVGICTTVSHNEHKRKNHSEYILIFYIIQPIDTAR